MTPQLRSDDRGAQVPAAQKVGRGGWIDLPHDELAALATRWQIEELAGFGSVIRDDFDRSSDVDVLATFRAGARWSLWDFEDLKEQLETLFGRPVDLIEKRALRNPYRKRHILSAAKVVQAA